MNLVWKSVQMDLCIKNVWIA